MNLRTLLVVAILQILVACSHTPDDQRIRQHIQAMQQAAEPRNSREIMAHLASDFSGNQGSVDREGLHNLLRAVVLRNENVGVTLGPIDVNIDGNRATASLIVTITGGQGGLLPEHGAIYAIDSAWRRDGKDWMCFAATWEEKL